MSDVATDTFGGADFADGEFTLLNVRRRRGLLSASIGIAAAATMTLPRSADARIRSRVSSSASVSVLTFGADPTGVADSSSAFKNAVAALPSTGGTVSIPSGTYLLNSPLTFGGIPLQLVGDGSAVTVLIMGHTGAAITINNPSSLGGVNPFSCRGLAIAGPSGSTVATAAFLIQYQMVTSLSVQTGYQYCFMDDISIGNSLVNGLRESNISYGLLLCNVCSSVFSNIRQFGASSGTFVSLNGISNNNTFENCLCDGPAVGYNVTGSAHGLRIVSPLIIAGTGITTDSSGAGPFQEMNIRGGEISCVTSAADLYNVYDSYIADTHLSASAAQASVVALKSCQGIRISNVQINGNYGSSGASSSAWGIIIGGSLCRISGMEFQNTLNGLQFAPGSTGNLALGLQLVDPNNFPHVETGPAAVDNSGITGSGANNAQWLNDQGQLVTLR